MTKIRVLALDDCELDLALLEENLKALSDWDVEFRGVHDPAEYRRLLVEGGIDVCFIDHNMGPVTGLDLLRSLRAEGIRTPIVALTGQRDKAVVEEFARAGAGDYLDKNELSPESLLRALQKVLRG
jgi:DNA-binding NarL/FixJ family response regulator